MLLFINLIYVFASRRHETMSLLGSFKWQILLFDEEHVTLHFWAKTTKNVKFLFMFVETLPNDLIFLAADKPLSRHFSEKMKTLHTKINSRPFQMVSKPFQKVFSSESLKGVVGAPLFILLEQIIKG